jgi:hypothetical protein
MIKPTMTQGKKARIYKSVQFMAVMAEVMKIEHMSELIDSDFKNPQVNQFAKRIKADAQAIQFHLKHNDRVNIAFKDLEFIEDYAGELYRVFHFFIGLPLPQIKEVMDNLSEIAEAVQ